jgi:DNA primase
MRVVVARAKRSGRPKAALLRFLFSLYAPMNSSVEEIKSRLNIVELVGAYVRLQKAGAHWKAPCPFHNEKTPSFMVSEERQNWHCFGCNKGGDLFSFLMEIEGIEFKEALRVLAEKAGVELSKHSRDRADGPKDRTYEILELATKFYERQLWDGAGRNKALPYLRGRGLSDETVRKFRLGYAPEGWRNVHDFLVARGYSPTEIEKAGLIIQKTHDPRPTTHDLSDPAAVSRQPSVVSHYDRFRDRVMFPIMDVLGRVIGYSARVTPGADESQAKYINTPETGAYRKSRALYGIQLAKQAMKAADFALLVEGNMDVVASHQVGISNTVAVSGTALTTEQLSLIRRYTENLRLFFDMDGAGQAAARRSAELALQAGMNVWIVAIPEGKDAADIAKESPEALYEAVERPTLALRYFLDRLLERYDRHAPDGKRLIAQGYLNLLRFVSQPIDRAYWVKKLAEALEVEEGILLGVLQKLPASEGSSERQAAPAAPLPDQSAFRKRSELLRRKMLSLMLLDGTVWREAVGVTEKDFGEFFASHRTYVLMRDRGEESRYSFRNFTERLEEEPWKQEMAKLSFEGEKEIEGAVFSDDEERRRHIREIFSQYARELSKELRREALLRLERLMREAREKGEKQREEELKVEFVRLSSQPN